MPAQSQSCQPLIGFPLDFSIQIVYKKSSNRETKKRKNRCPTPSGNSIREMAAVAGSAGVSPALRIESESENARPRGGHRAGDDRKGRPPASPIASPCLSTLWLGCSPQRREREGAPGAETDETYTSGLERNKHSRKKLRAGHRRQNRRGGDPGPPDRRGQGEGREAHRRRDPARLRRGEHRRDGDHLHRRGLHLTRPRSRAQYSKSRGGPLCW